MLSISLNDNAPIYYRQKADVFLCKIDLKNETDISKIENRIALLENNGKQANVVLYYAAKILTHISLTKNIWQLGLKAFTKLKSLQDDCVLEVKHQIHIDILIAKLKASENRWKIGFPIEKKEVLRRIRNHLQNSKIRDCDRKLASKLKWQLMRQDILVNFICCKKS